MTVPTGYSDALNAPGISEDTAINIPLTTEKGRSIAGKVYVNREKNVSDMDTNDKKLANVPIIFRWMDKDGSLSPYYKFTTDADGKFMIKVPDFTNKRTGTLHEFYALLGNKQRVKLYFAPEWFETEEGKKYVRGYDTMAGKFGGTTEQMTNTTWNGASPYIIYDYWITVQERPQGENTSEKTLFKPDAEWVENITPSNKFSDVERNNISGMVFYNFYASSLRASGEPIPKFDENKGDLPVKNHKVVLSMSDSSGKVVKTYYTHTNDYGQFKFTPQEDLGAYKNYIYTASPLEDMLIFSPYYTNDFLESTKVFGSIYKPLQKKLTEVNFAFTPRSKFEIEKYDTDDNYAKINEVVTAKTTSVAPLTGPYKIEWVKKDETVVKTIENLYSDATGNINDCSMTVPADLTEDTVYSARLYGPHKEIIEVDAFLAVVPPYAPEKVEFPADAADGSQDGIIKVGSGVTTTSVKVTLSQGNHSGWKVNLDTDKIPATNEYTHVLTNQDITNGYVIFNDVSIPPAGQILNVISSIENSNGKVSDKCEASVKIEIAKSTQPTIDDIDEGQKVIKGQGEPGAEITVKVNGETHTATVKADGTWEVTATNKLKAGDTVTATQKSGANNPSDEVTKYVTDVAPDSPTVNPVEEGDTIVKGKSQPGSTVIVKDKNGNKLGEAVADSDGNFSVPIPPLNPGDTVDVVAQDSGGTSAKTVCNVVDLPPEPPTVNDIDNASTIVTGKAQPNSEVTVYDDKGNVIGTGTADSSGDYSVSISPVDAGKTISVSAKDGGGEGLKTYKTVESEKLPVITVDNIDEIDTVIKGKTEPGATVTIVNKNTNSTIVTITADSYGNYTAYLSDPIPKGTIIEITADNGSKTNKATTVVSELIMPKPPVVDPIKEGNTQVTGTAKPNSTVTLNIYDDNGNFVGKYTVVADTNGKFKFIDHSIIVNIKSNYKFNLTVSEVINGKNLTSDPTKLTVSEVTKTDTPTVDPITAGDTQVTGTAKPNSTVTVYDKNGDVVGTSRADSSGKFTIPVNTRLSKDEIINVVADDGVNAPSNPAEVTVVAPVAEPIIYPVQENDRQIVVNTTTGAVLNVTVKDKDGNTIDTITVDEPDQTVHNIELPKDKFPDGLPAGSVVTAVATVNGKTSQKVDVEPANTTVPQPKVNPVTNKDSKITGTGVPGDTVYAEYEDGTHIGNVAVNVDGTFEISLSNPLPEGTVIKVTQKEDDRWSYPVKTSVQKSILVPPTLDPISNDSNKVTGKAQPGAKVTLIDENGNPIVDGNGNPYTGTADSDGNFVIDLDVPFESGKKIGAIADDGSSKPSVPSNYKEVAQKRVENLGKFANNKIDSEIFQVDVILKKDNNGNFIPNVVKILDQDSNVIAVERLNENRTVKVIKKNYPGITGVSIVLVDDNQNEKKIGPFAFTNNNNKNTANNTASNNYRGISHGSGYYKDKSNKQSEEANVLSPTQNNINTQKQVRVNERFLNVVDHDSYVSGYKDGSFRPNDFISRAEVAQILTNISRIKEDINLDKISDFIDVKKGQWYAPAIGFMQDNDIMFGYKDDTFKPNINITREEFVAVIARLIEADDDESKLPFADAKNRWSTKSIAKLYNAGLISGYTDGTFKPQRYITRAETVTIMNRLLGRKCDHQATEFANVVFNDVDKNHWAYFDIFEASISHDYKRRMENDTLENWTNLK